MKVHDRLYDAVIVGGGPAGLAAAIYMARARYRVLVLEKDRIGGQITITEEVVNYPGIARTSGRELAESMRAQAESFGAEFVRAEVLSMELRGEPKVLHTTAGDYEALGVILATGANPRKLGFKGEKAFQGRGVAYCATCDGEFFTGKKVFVIGGGYAAVEEGMFLAKYASSVQLIVRGEDFTCARAVSDKLRKEARIRVNFHTEIVEAGGEGMLQFARFRDRNSGEIWTYEAEAGDYFGIFVFAGYVPNTEWFRDQIECDEHGYVITDANQRTSLEGVYAAGDVCIKNLRQVVTAVRDGAVAATSLEKYVEALHERLSLPELWRPEKAEGGAEEMRESPKGTAGKAGREMESASEPKTGAGEASGQFISGELREKLRTLFAGFANPVRIVAELDESALSAEMSGFLEEFSEIETDRLICEKRTPDAETRRQREAAGERFPAFRIFRADGSGGNLIFHAVPGGHEFNSFVIALYNMAGEGQAVEAALREEIAALSAPVRIRIAVSLSCTMCPETVMAAQRIASLNPNVTAEMFDIAHFPTMREQYGIMSVPCMIIEQGEKEEIAFGKKNAGEIMSLLNGQ